MIERLQKITQIQQTNILAQYLRDDRLHIGKNIEGHPLRSILQGIAISFLDFRNKLILLETEMDINKANALLDFWEKLVGIPDDCIPIASTIEERRRNILIKFAWLQGNLKKQFEYILNLLGITNFTIESGIEQATLGNIILGDFHVLFDNETINFAMVITLPIELKVNVLGTAILGEFKLGNTILEFIECLFSKLKPAHAQIFYKFFNDIEYQFAPVTDDGYSLLTDDGFIIFS